MVSGFEIVSRYETLVVLLRGYRPWIFIYITLLLTFGEVFGYFGLEIDEYFVGIGLVLDTFERVFDFVRLYS